MVLYNAINKYIYIWQELKETIARDMASCAAWLNFQEEDKRHQENRHFCHWPMPATATAATASASASGGCQTCSKALVVYCLKGLKTFHCWQPARIYHSLHLPHSWCLSPRRIFLEDVVVSCYCIGCRYSIRAGMGHSQETEWPRVLDLIHPWSSVSCSRSF